MSTSAWHVKSIPQGLTCHSSARHHESQWWSRPRLCCQLNNMSAWDWGFTWGQACSTTAGELLQLPPLGAAEGVMLRQYQPSCRGAVAVLGQPA